MLILNHQVGAQINSENVNKKIFIPNENNSPSLFAPKEESPFLNKDPFKKDPNNNPNEEFIDPSKKYLKKLNKKKEEDQNPNNFGRTVMDLLQKNYGKSPLEEALHAPLNGRPAIANAVH